MKTILNLLFAFSMIISITFLSDVVSSNNPFSAQAQPVSPRTAQQRSKSKLKASRKKDAAILTIIVQNNTKKRQGNQASSRGRNKRSYDTGGGGGVGAPPKPFRNLKGNKASNRVQIRPKNPLLKGRIRQGGIIDPDSPPWRNRKNKVINPARRRQH